MSHEKDGDMTCRRIALLGLLAGVLPARRAARLDAVDALRAE